MTISKEEHEREKQQILIKALEILHNGDDLLLTNFLERDQFPKVHETTWLYLFQDGLLEDMGDGGSFTLTPEGWIVALELTGQINDQSFVDRLSRVCTVVRKKITKDRDSFAIIPVNSIAIEANVPEDWLFNIIEARMIEYKFGQVGIKHSEERGSAFIPLNVGHKL